MKPLGFMVYKTKREEQHEVYCPYTNLEPNDRPRLLGELTPFNLMGRIFQNMEPHLGSRKIRVLYVSHIMWPNGILVGGFNPSEKY